MLDSLAPSERRVGQAILEDPGAAIALSIGEFAELCGVAQPTLSRFAKNVGFHGYPALRLGIAHDFAADRDAQNAAGTGKPSNQPAQEAIRVDAALPVLAGAIRGATAVEIWSAPEFAAGGQLLAASLRGLGVPAAASAIPSHWHRRAVGLPPGGLVLLLGQSVTDLPVAQAAQRAREAQVGIASATSKSMRSSNVVDDIVLSLPDVEPGEMLGLWVAAAVTEAVRDVSMLAGPPGPASPWVTWPYQREVFLPTSGDPIPGVLFSQPTHSAKPTLILYLTGMHGAVARSVRPEAADNHVDASILAALLNAGHHVLFTENPAHGMRKKAWEDAGVQIRASLRGEGEDVLLQSRTEATALVDGALSLGIIDDPRHLAVVGQSWGGLQALLKMAGDDRISCGVGMLPVCDPATLEPFTDCGDEPRVVASSLRGPLGSAIVPRPLLLISGVDDPTATAAQVKDFEERLRPEYEAAGRASELQHVSLIGVAHNIEAGLLNEVIGWLDKNLLG